MVIFRDVTFDESISPSHLERPALSVSELRNKINTGRSSKTLPISQSASNTSTNSDVFEAVGDIPRAVEAVGAEDKVGVQGPERRQEENAEENDQPQYRGWDYELDPRYARSPAPTPEPELEEEQVPDRTRPFVTRSGRHWGLVLSAANDYELELNDNLCRPGEIEYHTSDARIPLWSSDFSPHSLAALASQAVNGTEPRSWREALASIEAKQWQAAAQDEMQTHL